MDLEATEPVRVANTAALNSRALVTAAAAVASVQGTLEASLQTGGHYCNPASVLLLLRLQVLRIVQQLGKRGWRPQRMRRQLAGARKHPVAAVTTSGRGLHALHVAFTPVLHLGGCRTFDDSPICTRINAPHSGVLSWGL